MQNKQIITKKNCLNQKAKTFITKEEETINTKINKFIISTKENTSENNKLPSSEREESSEKPSDLNHSNSKENSIIHIHKSFYNTGSNYKEGNNKRKKFIKYESRNTSLENEKNNNYDSVNFIKNQQKNRKIFIRNIGKKTKKSELSDIFHQYGEIKKIEIFKNNKGKNNGLGFVEFNNPESAISAINNSNQIEIKGRKLKLDYWKSKIDLKFEEFEKKINKKTEADKRELQNKFMETNKKLMETNIIVGILTEINLQSEKYINNYIKKTINNTNMKLNSIINAFKVLYYRKIANFILYELVNRYSKSLAVTSKKFYNQRVNFNLIVATEEIKGINVYQINLIFDYLMHIKEKASAIIHINEKTLVQKQIFNIYIKNIRKINDDSSNSDGEIIKIDEMVNTLFKKPEYIEQIIDLNKDEYTINQIENIIKNEKEKTIEKNEDNENNIDIKSNESSTSNSEYDINKLQRILDGKEDIKTNLVILLETLHKKIILNEQKVKEDFIEFGVEEKNSEYFIILG